MTADQREIHTMPIIKERKLVPNIPGLPVDSPFPNGRLVLAGRDTKWDIRNDGVLITFREAYGPYPPGGTDDPLSLCEPIEEIIAKFSVFKNIFTFDRVSPFVDYRRQPRVFTIPTIATLNEFSQDVFRGLNTAGIQLVQTYPENEKSDGEAPVELYVNELLNGHLVVSSQPQPFPRGYLHDLIVHGISAITIEKSEMDVFQALGEKKDNIGRLYGDAIKGSYIARLGDAFDLYTASYVGPPHLRRDYLPDFCLKHLDRDLSHLQSTGNKIATALPEAVLRGSQQIVERYRTADYGNKRSEHYDNIDQRLKQPPWIPADYVLSSH